MGPMLLRSPTALSRRRALCRAARPKGAPLGPAAYGDSITYGWIPNPNPPSTRNGPEDRWPGALQKELGNNYQVIEEGLDGRTTDARDPGSPISGAQLDGSAYLPACLASHLPVDLVIIMLGTNDLTSI